MLSWLACCVVRESDVLVNEQEAELLKDEDRDASSLFPCLQCSDTLKTTATFIADVSQQACMDNSSCAAACDCIGLDMLEQLLWGSVSRPWFLVFGVLIIVDVLRRSLQDTEPGDRLWVDAMVAAFGVFMILLAHQILGNLQKILTLGVATTFGQMKPMAAPAAPLVPDGVLVEALLAQFEDRTLETSNREIDWKTCKRFLQGQKGNFEEAACKLKKYQAWRRSTQPGLITEKDIPKEFATRKSYHHAFDRAGRPVIWIFARRHDKWCRDVDETTRLIIFCLEAAICAGEARGTEQVTLVFDLDGFGPRSMDLEMVRSICKMLRGLYPERMGQVLLWRAPPIFGMFWKALKPCFDPVTFAKINFVEATALCEFIDFNNLPDDVVSMQKATTT